MLKTNNNDFIHKVVFENNKSPSELNSNSLNENINISRFDSRKIENSSHSINLEEKIKTLRENHISNKTLSKKNVNINKENNIETYNKATLDQKVTNLNHKINHMSISNNSRSTQNNSKNHDQNGSSCFSWCDSGFKK